MSSVVTAWARNVTPESFTFAALERVLFQQHPVIVEAIDADTTYATTTPRARRGTGWLAFLFALLLFLIPVFGVAVYGEHDYLSNIPRTSPDTYIPGSAVSFLLTAGVLLVMGIVWLVRGARWSPMLAAYAALVGVLSIFAIVGVPQRALSDGVRVPDLLLWPARISLAVAVILLLGLLVRLGTRTRLPDADATPDEVIAQLVRRLPGTVRQDLKASRKDALEILRARNVIDESLRTRASTASLGMMHRVGLFDTRPAGDAPERA